MNFLQKKKKDIIRSLQKKLVDILDLKADRNIMGPPLINTLMEIQFQNMQIDDWEAGNGDKCFQRRALLRY